MSADIERLNTEVSLQRLAEGRGITLKGRASVLTGSCPFHARATPTITVDTRANTWACKSCKVTAGSVIDFTMKAEGISKRHAVELLRGDVGVGVTPSKVVRTSTSKKLPDVITGDGDDAALFGQVVSYYNDSLKRDGKALAFLTSNNITDAEVIETFTIGLSDRSLGYRIPKANRKAGAEIRARLQRLGLVRDTGHEVLRGCITVPIADDNGVIRSAYGRRLQLDTRKAESPDVYVGSGGLFNPAAFTSSKDIVICSTPFEALVLWSAGIRNVTAVNGLDADADDLTTTIVNNGVTKIVFVFPRSKAGEKAVTGLVGKMGTVAAQLFRGLLPAGMDIVSFAASSANTNEKLAAVVRAAEWVGGVKPTNPEHAIPTIITERSSEWRATPTTATAPAGEITIELGDRRWRIRGLGKNVSYETMRVNVHVSRDTGDPRTSGFHVDNVELYAARQRHVFIEQAGEELGIAPEVVKRDLGQVLLRLEGIQDETIRAALAPKEEVPVMTDTERESALALLRDPHLLDRVAEDFEKAGVVGERKNLVIGYLAATSRKLNDPLAVLVQSSSAAGKSSLLDAVLAFIPEEERVEFSAMTGQSLFYMEGGALRHRVLAISEEAGAQRASYALKLLQSAGSLTIASTAKEAGTGRMVTHEYRVEGPVSLMMTTTAIEIDPELANRCIVLSVDEGVEQTRAIHRRQREAETLQGHLARESRERLLALHQNAQRLLLPVLVVNPFANEMTFSDASTRARRDHRKLLTLVRSIALLHQHQRQRKTVEHEGSAVEYIEVTKSDIETALKLVDGILGPSLDDLPPHTKVVLGMLDRMVSDVAHEQGIERGDVRFTRREARERLGLGNTQCKTHFKRLVEAEMLVVHPARHGRGVVYELAFEIHAYDGERSGAERPRSGHGRPLVGPRSGGGRRVESETSSEESRPTDSEGSGSPETNHRAGPSKSRRTSASRSNGASA